jgi:hypothetical protein
MTADTGLFSSGLLGGASLSTPVSPGGGGELPASEVSPGSGTSPATGGGGTPSGTGGVSGASAGGGGGSSPTGAAGGSGLPFTGFPVAVVAAIGGALTASGAALRRAVRRGPR